MSRDSTSPFGNVLEGLLLEKEKFHKPRSPQRIKTDIPALIEIKGQIHEVKLLDISPTVLRIDHKFSTTLKEQCVVIVKTTPSIQLICAPLIQEAEFEEAQWSRLKIKSSVRFDELKSRLSGNF